MESVILVILVIIPGVWSRSWQVTLYSQCALRGTSVDIACSYDYPFGHLVRSVQWSKREFVSGKWRLTPLTEISPYPDHFKYLGNYRSDCTLRINAVQHADQGAYVFSFVTTFERWRSKEYAYLSIKELTAVVRPATVTEGDRVSLSYLPGCPSLRPAVVWFRDGQPVTNSGFQATAQDAGRYYCAVRGQEDSRSAVVTLNVQYHPKKVTLSVSRSHVVKGSSMTFACSSDANPAVTHSGYSLHKDGEFISSGENYSISDVQPSHSGRYYCQAQNGISNNGVNFTESTKVDLDVQFVPENVSVSMDPPNAVEGSSVNLTCSSAANPAADSYTWYWRSAAPSSRSLQPVGSGPVLSLASVEASHSGLYLCQARNPLGENNSTELLLEMVKNKPDVLLPALAGVGVTLLVALLVALLWFWKKQKQTEKHLNLLESRLSERGSSSSAVKEEADLVYANIHVSLTSPPPTATQDIAVTSAKRKSPHTGHARKAPHDEEEIIYSTVTIKSRNNTNLQHHINNRHALQDTWSNSGERDNSVIYTTVVSAL
ncbi:hypothetical protein LDENG_00033300 [Lucifuga dentata]|nr:hypothetical protein LDENG_00033300 [Lucifuga dentata]